MQLQHAVHNGSVRARADRIDGTLKSLGELSTTTSMATFFLGHGVAVDRKKEESYFKREGRFGPFILLTCDQSCSV